jgi:hypothetical protein
LSIFECPYVACYSGLSIFDCPYVACYSGLSIRVTGDIGAIKN